MSVHALKFCLVRSHTGKPLGSGLGKKISSKFGTFLGIETVVTKTFAGDLTLATEYHAASQIPLR